MSLPFNESACIRPLLFRPELLAVLMEAGISTRNVFGSRSCSDVTSGLLSQDVSISDVASPAINMYEMNFKVFMCFSLMLVFEFLSYWASGSGTCLPILKHME